MELAEVVSSAARWSAHLHVAVVAYARFSQHLFLHLFVCSRSLAIHGLPGNHHALRQWDRTAVRTIETLGSLAGTCDHAGARRSTVRPDVATKPNVREQ